MKRLLFLLTMAVFVFLSACAAAEEEPQYIEVSFRENMRFDLDQMMFVKQYPYYDVIDDLGTPFMDYMLVRDINDQTALTVEQEAAYEDLFAILATATSSARSYEDVLSGSVSDFSELTTTLGVTIEPKDVFTFLALQSEIATLQESGSLQISKEVYVEYWLERDLTLEEVAGLDNLQEIYAMYLQETNRGLSITTFTFEELMLEFETYLQYDPNEEVRVQLELAYEVLQQLYQIE